MKKNFIGLCLGAMSVVLASCGGNNNPVLEGYDFAGDGLLGKIPMGLAIQHGTALEINHEFNKEYQDIYGDKKIGEGTEEDYQKMQEAEKKADDKLNHCVDDIYDDLVADSARLRSLKDINLENKTSCNVKLKEVRFTEEDMVSVKNNIVFVLDAPQTEVAALPDGKIYAIIVDKEGKLFENIGEPAYFRTKKQYANSSFGFRNQAVFA